MHADHITAPSRLRIQDPSSCRQEPGRRLCRAGASADGFADPRRVQSGRPDRRPLLLRFARRHRGSDRRQRTPVAASRHVRAGSGARHRLCTAGYNRISNHLGRRSD